MVVDYLNERKANMYLTAEELEDIAYKIIVCTEEEKVLIEESLTDWQLTEVHRYVEQILARVEQW